MLVVSQIRKALRPVRRLYERVFLDLKESPYKERRSPRGSARWLIESEVHYGGFVTDVARSKVSEHDPRTTEQLSLGGMTGGDRMLHHGYAAGYAKYLAPFVGVQGATLAEFGILKGTGLAIWCDLFPDGNVLGFDIDLQHFWSNRPALEARGAFQAGAPALFEYDQFCDGRDIIARALKGRTLDFVIDDGYHSVDTIVKTWRSCQPFLSPRFAYLIEDYGGLLDVCAEEFEGYVAEPLGALTAISRL